MAPPTLLSEAMALNTLRNLNKRPAGKAFGKGDSNDIELLAEAKRAAKRAKPSTAEEKCVHARELNRIASIEYRKRKKTTIDGLQKNVRYFSSANENIKKKNAQLELMVEAAKQLVAQSNSAKSLGEGAVGISGATGLNQEPAASNLSSLYAAPTASTTTAARDPSNLSSTLGSGMLGAAAGYPQDQSLAKSLAVQQVAMYQQHPDVTARSLPMSSLHAMLLSERLQQDAAAMAASSSSAAAITTTANPYAATVENLRNEALRFVFNAGLNSIAGASSGSGMGATSSARNVMISSNMAAASSMAAAAASSLKVDLSRMSSILSASSSSRPPPVAAASLPVSHTNLASSTAANVSTTVAQPQQQQQQPQCTSSIVEEIVQLQMFRAKGILTEFEFQMAKKKLLGLP